METRYEKWYSPALEREMEIKSFGHAGRPVLYIPCQNGRFYDFENFGMAAAWEPFIESGQVTVFSVDTMDQETWSDKAGNPYWRIRRHEAWMRYLRDEVVAYIHGVCRGRGWKENPGVMAFGASLGATHAVNLFFRFPEKFDSLLALSGIYNADYGFDGYMDELVYLNSPLHYLPNMPADHPFIPLYNRHHGVVCSGQGPWEIPESTRALHKALSDKGIQVWVDYWGFDAAHDWDWWYKQVAYFVPKLLEAEQSS